MNVFETFFNLGISHILDIAALDHILFLIVLCAVYQLSDWKKLLILISAFTVGHSLTLALATMQLINISTSLIEFLIPLTIIITAFVNLFHKTNNISKKLHLGRYVTALGFGLIHGLAFSNELRLLLFQSNNLWNPLLGFNLGVESGQLIFISSYLLFAFVLISIFRIKQREMNLVLSGAGMGVALLLLVERWPI